MGTVKWIVVFALLSIACQSAALSGLHVSVFSVTSKSMAVQWTKYSSATSYKITVTPKNSPSHPAFAQFGPNSVMGSVNSLSPNTLYTVKVEAMDASLNVLSQAQVEKITAPEVPSVVMATSKQSDRISVEFTSAPGATSYVLRTETADGSFFSETDVSSSPGTVTNLKPYTDYILSVLSVNSGGRSQPSLPAEAKTVVAAPHLITSSPSNSSIVVVWQPVANAVRYTLSLIMGGSNITDVNITSPNVTFSDLEAGRVYAIKANAWDAMNRQGDDAHVSQITRPPTPSIVQMNVSRNESSAGLSVSWHLVQGASDYLVLSSEGINCTSAVGTCTLAPLACGQEHTLTVTARNLAGPSPPSAAQEFTSFPCPPEPVWVEETQAGNCSVTWGPMPYADKYVAFIKRDDGIEERCNTTNTTCDFHCQCGYTFLMTVFAYNLAGGSPPGPVLNYTTLPCCPEDVRISLVSTDTLEIEWSAARGAEVYETRAVEGSNVILCNDTSPVCALSDLTCDRPYSVMVIPCSEGRGCNWACGTHTKETAPCMSDILGISQVTNSSVSVNFTTPNRAANYTVTAAGAPDTHTCQSSGPPCVITNLPCGSAYDVSVLATTAVGQSVPSYVVTLETAPCCPETLNVHQVTQAMTNVTWSPARGAQSFVTALTSSKGHARCHTQDLHCLMGCITCGTNYTVSMEAYSRTGHKSECTYRGFSSSPCCPSGVKLYQMSNNTLRVYWRSAGALHNTTADVYGSQTNYTCSPVAGGNSCDVSDILCGDVYTVVVAPLTTDGTTVPFCPQRMYSVSCSGGNVGMVMYRGKRSLD
ncbi:fibronectin type III domain-containing protein 7-like [Osmerus mordax]|uniref:fibronectin type III domain-containing protein 7-like n=1 Tax=Osmerus mordax TaxID=8014 RepID=UPI0035101514